MHPTNPTTLTPPSNSSTTFKLSVMMFLQFFLWGAWFVTLGPFMGARGFAPEQIGNAYSTAPVGAILAPLFLGVIADRFFASQRVMALLHILGGALLLLAPSLAASGQANPWPFIGILLAHFLCYMPTLGLSNTIALHAMTNPEKQFPLVRVWGTIGWIVAGFSVGLLAKQLITAAPEGTTLESARAASPHFFYIAGASGILLGLFSLALPHTPPPAKGKPAHLGSILGFDAISLLKDRSFAVFILCSTLICIPLAAYYAFAATFAGQAGIQDVPIKMTFGQMSEIAFMLVMPLFFARLGVKWLLAVGMLAWVLRYVLFSAAWAGPAPDAAHVAAFVLAGIILHGICYDFFFVTGQIYTDRAAPAHVRAQAQGFLVLVTQGVGMLIGNQVFSRLVGHYTDATTKVVDWRTVWLIPAAFAFAVLLVFIALFKTRRDPTPSTT